MLPAANGLQRSRSLAANPAVTCKPTLQTATREASWSAQKLLNAHDLGLVRWAVRCGYVRDPVANRATALQTVGRAPYAQRTSVENMRINHRRADICVAEQLLNGSNVVAILDQVRRK